VVADVTLSYCAMLHAIIVCSEDVSSAATVTSHRRACSGDAGAVLCRHRWSDACRPAHRGVGLQGISRALCCCTAALLSSITVSCSCPANCSAWSVAVLAVEASH
jgi:hypothetical protein